MPVIDLSNCELMLFVGCDTAAAEGMSLPDAAVAAGADCAIGFKTGINCGLANTWIEKFFEFYSQGRTIDESAQQATSNSQINIEDMRIVS